MVSSRWTRIAVQFQSPFSPPKNHVGTLVPPVLEKAIWRQPAELSPGAPQRSDGRAAPCAGSETSSQGFAVGEIRV